jgi:hypothetical protein
MAYDRVSDLIRAFREDEKDTIAPYFWSDAQLVRWVNEGLIQFAEESRSFYDEESDATLLPYVAGEDRFELDPCVIDVVGAWVEGQRHCELRRNLLTFGNGFRGGYWLAYNGCSSHFHFDGGGFLRLHPKPAANDMLPGDRRHLLSYMAYKAYRVNEGETYNRGSSDEHLRRFEEACQNALEKSILRRGDCSRPIRSNW